MKPVLRTFAVIGDPIDHSMSPAMHNAAFRELGMDATYIAYRIPRGELEEGVQSLKRIAAAGFNVTIPHKIEVMRFLDRTDESCSLVGAANTVVNDGGALKGYNTDMDGFLDPIKRRGIGIRGESVLLLGAGGAARAIVAGFAREGAGRITIANRSPRGARELARFAGRMGQDAEVAGGGGGRAGGDPADPSGHKFIVNATPVGMRGEPSPVRTGRIPADSVVYDAVYAPMNTDLIKGARKAGAVAIYGYEMLLGQATRSFEIWHRRKAPHSAMKGVLVGPD